MPGDRRREPVAALPIHERKFRMPLASSSRVVVLALMLLFSAPSTLLLCSAPDSPAGTDSAVNVRTTVLVVYYSVTGNTEQMAHAVAEGAQNAGSVDVVTRTPDKVTEADLKTADAIILGSPTYFGDMASPMKAFIDDWWLKYRISLTGKVGGAFSSGGSESGGNEHVLYSFIIAMMNAGMIIVGPLEGPFGLAGVTSLNPVSDKALQASRALGERAAGVARKLKAGSR